MQAADQNIPGQERPQLVLLTLLRFVAAAWVVVYIFWPRLGLPMPSVVEKGRLGVETFFILSGFVLSHVYLDSAAFGQFKYGAFLKARMARIYPMHLLTLVAVICLGGVALLMGRDVNEGVLSWKNLPANLFLVQAWGFADQSAFNHGSWSISAEWFAYLTFPIFAAFALRLHRRPILAVGLAAALMIGVHLGFAHFAKASLSTATIYFGALRIVPCFALGCALNLLYRSERISHPIWGASLAGIGLLCIVLFAVFNIQDVWIALASGGMILGLAILSDYCPSTKAFVVGTWLGEISYSIYMLMAVVDMVYFNIVEKITGISANQTPILWWILGVLSLIPLAGLTHRLIETPARLWLRSWGIQKKPDSTSALFAR